MLPFVAPMVATVFSLKLLFPSGRVPQAMAFVKRGGMVRLYSGVIKRTPSAFCIVSLRTLADSGNAESSRSRLYIGSASRSGRTNAISGASAFIVSNKATLKDPLREEPTRTTTECMKPALYHCGLKLSELPQIFFRLRPECEGVFNEFF